MSSKVRVVEKNQGQKIDWKQSSSKLTFGDDELMVNIAKYQRDWPVHLDVCGDKSGNLVIGVGEGRYYVAQIDIPATRYTEPEIIMEQPTPADEDGETEGRNTMRETTPPEPIPLELSDVTLTLWAIDGLRV